MFFQYLYRDEPQLSRFQSGLVFADDRWKPSLQAFRLPFAQMGRSGERAIVWGFHDGDLFRLDLPARRGLQAQGALGPSCQIRTDDQLFTKQLLCQLSYAGVL